jgi:hypothetical protein
MLNFSLSGPTCYTFMQYYFTYLKSNLIVHDEYQCLTMLSNYLCTLALIDDQLFSSFRSSMIAASCLFYAHQLLNCNASWTHRHSQITSYTHVELHECVIAIKKLHEKMFHQQDLTTSSLLRRYSMLKKNTINDHHRVRQLIHHAKISNEDDPIDLTLDDMNDDSMSLTDYQT